jgi:hypothetical protein
MSDEKALPSQELLVEAVRWLLQLDMNDPKNLRPDVRQKTADGAESGVTQRKR